MKHGATLRSLVVTSHPLLEDESNLKTFLSEHFYITAPNPLMVCISGSSEQNMHHTGPKQVLDASSLHCDEHNIIMATADGLGESEDDLKDNENNANISAFCTESFCKLVATNKAKPDSQLFTDIASESRKKNQKSAWGQSYDGRTAMSTFAYDAHSQQATVMSIGDTLTVVFDGKTGDVKYQQKARVYNQAGSIWAPVDIQVLAHNNPSIASSARSALQEYHWELSENDIVIQMTDGVWSELPTLDKEYIFKDSSYIETELVISNIADIDDSFSPENLSAFNALDIGIKIHSKAMTHYHNNLAAFRSIHQEIMEKLQSESNPMKPMQEFVDELPQPTAALFKQLYVGQKHDAIPYHDEMPVVVFLRNYQRISFGDCSTISVAKIPNSYEFLFIKLLENMDSLYKYQDLLQEIVKIPSVEIATLVKKLNNYRLIPEDKTALSDSVGVHAYPQAKLEFLILFIQHYKNCMVFNYSSEDPDVVRGKTLEYIKALQTPEEQKFLSLFLNKCTHSSFIDNLHHYFFKPASQEGVSLYEYKEELDKFSNGFK